ncbi:HutD family protein [Shewanella avicenniae]|uniref:HutD family protein n=1 Tax=Shewanella avicenniae TaxID=2814294 RepID=A0ABX7QU96_9GAMM|nr:HutD family protein [Shewanella avicenniae]QSX35071.1 HutD family protein [Shewanella avicenniae]
MRMTYLPRSGYQRVPWKNGLGVTEEIAKQLDPATQQFIWRLSIATVAEDGPFSLFTGYQRIISVLAGKGMVLTVNGLVSEAITEFHPFTFDGAANTECRLVDGGIFDFNVIYDPQLVSATLIWQTIAPEKTLELAANHTHFILVGKGDVKLQTALTNQALSTWDAVKIDAEQQSLVLQLSTHSSAIVAVVSLAMKVAE